MGRAAHQQHDVVRNIHQRRNRALPATLQALYEPSGRFRARIDASQDPASESTAQIGRMHTHRQNLGQRGLDSLGNGFVQSRAC